MGLRVLRRATAGSNRLGRAGAMLAAGALVVALTAGMAAPAGAYVPGGSVGNYVTVINIRNNSQEYRMKWDMEYVYGPNLNATNQAYAKATCDNCNTAAVAFQIVLASGVKTVNANNSGVALNVACQNCDTQAVADQFVVASPGSVWITPQGILQLWSLRQQFEDLHHPGATPESIVAGVTTIDVEVMAVLEADVRFGPLQPWDVGSGRIEHHLDWHPAY
jgi:hypothetical protein